MEYKGVAIELREAHSIVGVEGPYYVHNANGLVFCAITKFGSCYALNSETVLQDAKQLIDDALTQGV